MDPRFPQSALNGRCRSHSRSQVGTACQVCSGRSGTPTRSRRWWLSSRPVRSDCRQREEPLLKHTATASVTARPHEMLQQAAMAQVLPSIASWLSEGPQDHPLRCPSTHRWFKLVHLYIVPVRPAGPVRTSHDPGVFTVSESGPHLGVHHTPKRNISKLSCFRRAVELSGMPLPGTIELGERTFIRHATKVHFPPIARGWGRNASRIGSMTRSNAPTPRHLITWLRQTRRQHRPQMP